MNKSLVQLSMMMSCGGCGDTILISSKHSCKKCGRMLCGTCGKHCKDCIAKNPCLTCNIMLCNGCEFSEPLEIRHGQKIC